MSPYRDQIAAAVDAVTIRGPTRYGWLGRPRRALPASIDAELDDRARRSYLVTCLGEDLYSSFYCHGRPVPARWGEPEPPFEDPELYAELSAANCGQGSWATGWTVRHRDDGEVAVASARLRARVPIGDCRAEGGAVGPGAAVMVRLPKELPSLSPGFYTAVGDAVAGGSPAGIVRVYWNVTRAGAAALVRALTETLNRAQVPFRLKVADHPLGFERCDAAVLYLATDAFGATRSALREIASRLSGRLEPEIPAFTLLLAPGVGLAEEHGDGDQSFGERRCALLAEGIVRAHERGHASAAARLDAVADTFARDGVQIEAPYREPSLAGRHPL
jgi:hypothetical protein